MEQGKEDLRELGDLIASSKVLVLQERVADCDALPQHKGTIQYQRSGELICNFSKEPLLPASLY